MCKIPVFFSLLQNCAAKTFSTDNCLELSKGYFKIKLLSGRLNTRFAFLKTPVMEG